MRKHLESTSAILIELVGLIIGFFWGLKSNWDYEPLIIFIGSGLGCLTFLGLKYFPDTSDKPFIDGQLISKRKVRMPPEMIKDVSPKGFDSEVGEYYEFKEGGIYLFKIIKNYELVLRNNSINNAYNIVVYKNKVSYPLSFKNTLNPLIALTINNPQKIELEYIKVSPMTHEEARKVMEDDVPEDMKNLNFLIVYQSEKRKTFFTKFIPMHKNEYFDSISDMDLYEPIS